MHPVSVAKPLSTAGFRQVCVVCVCVCVYMCVFVCVCVCALGCRQAGLSDALGPGVQQLRHRVLVWELQQLGGHVLVDRLQERVGTWTKEELENTWCFLGSHTKVLLKVLLICPKGRVGKCSGDVGVPATLLLCTCYALVSFYLSIRFQ